ncbi:MAG: hypothetical protein B7Z31_05850 [Rhodobacterales bacterium 12-65-15]|nr:MAG: hypothetical protein B7Z31_05850 [Rhodobacterales bacterium 12-65-15]
MRPVDRVRTLHQLVKASRKTVVVDVGANPFNGSPVYGLLRRAGVARIIGFEPQAEALAALQQAAGPDEVYLPYAVGSGSTETLYLTKNSGLVSTLQPAPWIGRYLSPWWRKAIVVGEEASMPTVRLDDLSEIETVDFLKIDIQGGELKVFQNARRKLATTALVQTEVAILRYYQNQPTLGEVQAELEGQGFLAHKFVEISAHHVGYRGALAGKLPIRGSQATTADLAFVRDPTEMETLPLDTVQHLAILADAVLRSYDLVFRCLTELVRRGVVDAADIGAYVTLLEGTVYRQP